MIGGLEIAASYGPKSALRLRKQAAQLGFQLLPIPAQDNDN